MAATRLVGFLALALFVYAAVGSAQPLPPGVKLPPVVKPGGPAPGPAPGPADPKGKVPGPIPPGGVPGVPPGVGIPVPPAVPSPPKKDEIKWPTEVNGKTLEATIKDMRTHPDPAVREASIRALPQFGPKGRELGGDKLIEAMSAKEGDWNVRQAAVSVAPSVIMGFAKGPDSTLTNGLSLLSSLLTNTQILLKYEAIAAVASVGPYMRTANPKIVGTLMAVARDQNSWQIRRAAVGALGSVGQGTQVSESEFTPPDPDAVKVLLDVLQRDICAAVRSAAVNSLISLGPVGAGQLKDWRTALDNVFKKGIEKDKSVLLWVRVLVILNDPKGLEGNEAHLKAIGDTLRAPEAAGRLEACEALAMLGEEGKSKLQSVLDLITDPKEEPLVVAGAIMAAAAVPSQANVTIKVLENVKATHKNEDVRKLAGEAIDNLNGKKKN